MKAILQHINIVGLGLDFIGAVFLLYGLIISEKKAVELSVSYICGDTHEENLPLPTTRDLLKQSRNAITGMAFLVMGFLLQIIGSWPSR